MMNSSSYQPLSTSAFSMPWMRAASVPGLTGSHSLAFAAVPVKRGSMQTM